MIKEAIFLFTWSLTSIPIQISLVLWILKIDGNKNAGLSFFGSIVFHQLHEAHSSNNCHPVITTDCFGNSTTIE